MQKCIVVFFGGFFSIRPSVGFQIFLLLLKNIYFVFFVVQRKTFFLNPVSFKVIFFFKFTSSKSYHKKKLRFYVQQIFFLFLLLFFLLETYLYKYTFISLSFIYFFIYTTLFLSLKIFAGLSARYLNFSWNAFSWRIFWVCYCLLLKIHVFMIIPILSPWFESKHFWAFFWHKPWIKFQARRKKTDASFTERKSQLTVTIQDLSVTSEELRSVRLTRFKVSRK